MFFFKRTSPPGCAPHCRSSHETAKPSRSRNGSEQRVHPSWFYLGTLSTKLGIIFLPWQNTAASFGGEARRFGFCDVTSGRVIFLLPSWPAPVTSLWVESSAINHGVLGAPRGLGALGNCLLCELSPSRRDINMTYLVRQSPLSTNPDKITFPMKECTRVVFFSQPRRFHLSKTGWENRLGLVPISTGLES